MKLVDVYNKVTGENVTVKNKRYDLVLTGMWKIKEATTLEDAILAAETFLEIPPERSREFAEKVRELCG